MTHKILLLEGDGIGPEIVGAAVDVLNALRERFGFQAELEPALMGGAAIDATGDPLPEDTRELMQAAEAKARLGVPKQRILEELGYGAGEGARP